MWQHFKTRVTGGSPTSKAPCFGDARVLIVGEWAIRSRRCLESVLGFVRGSVSQERGFEVSLLAEIKLRVWKCSEPPWAP